MNFTVGTYNAPTKEMFYYSCVAFNKTAMRVLNFYHPKRSVFVHGRLGNNVYIKPGADKSSRSVAFIVTTIDYPTDGEGVPTVQDVFQESIKNREDPRAEKFEVEVESTPSAVPDDPGDLPF